jgi:dihydrodipicolinate synthase/N-acetylneuraminate lyase
LPPFFLGASESAIINHLRAIAAAVSIPIVIQYAPVQTGVKLGPEVFVQLSGEFENIQFVKVECQPPGPYVSALQQGAAGRIKSLVGYAGVQMPDVLARGAVGIQPGCSFSEVYVRLFELFAAGDLPGMLSLHSRLLPYISYWMQGIELLIKAEKIILKRRGIIKTDYCRAMSYVIDRSEDQLIDAFLREFADFLR